MAQTPTQKSIKDIVEASLPRRRRAEKRFRLYGLIAVCMALFFLGLLFYTIIGNGWSAFRQTEMRLTFSLEEEVSGPVDAEAIRNLNVRKLVKTAMRDRFPEVSGRGPKRQLSQLISSGAPIEFKQHLLENPDVLTSGTFDLWLPASDEVDMWLKGENSRLTPQQIEWVQSLRASGELELKFNWRFFTSGDSREPELAGIWGAVAGSFWMLMVTLLLSFPIGVMASVYLEEFAPKNRWTDLIEVNINNLAAVPSIVFGLLGLALFLNLFGLPRSAPLVGGMVLSLMTLPTIIIAGRAAMKSVPPSIREAALGMGASRLQAVTHHILPLAMPGMLTGAIIGMAQALGETAPLLMIGMVAFIVDIPASPVDPSAALPVQIYLWADSPERAFVERMAAAIMVLLAFLIIMNLVAILLRSKFERRW